MSTDGVTAPSTHNEFAPLFRGENRALAPQILEVINGLSDYWPMSLRQIYYQAVAGLLVKNDDKQYRRVMKICKRLREEDLLPWRAMEDRGRRTAAKRGLSGLQEFLEQNMEGMLNWKYYHKCYLKGQENYVEVTVEKDALAPLVEEVLWPLCTMMSVTKGQPSATLMEQIGGRMDSAMQRGQNPVLLHFGDLDPTGIQIPKSMEQTLWDIHGIRAEVVMGGLTPEQCKEHSLPESLDAAKSEDPNYGRWMEEHGQDGQAPTELDALHPAALQDVVRERVLECYDDDQMREQEEQEQEDREKLKKMRKQTMAFLQGQFPEEMKDLQVYP